ncbi:hypothetical protein C7S15_3085 [Burkholderia cepacia]|nr:hypothetical protein [Burkholderia cepacia]
MHCACLFSGKGPHDGDVSELPSACHRSEKISVAFAELISRRKKGNGHSRNDS